jgi:hypothetical protein
MPPQRRSVVLACMALRPPLHCTLLRLQPTGRKELLVQAKQHAKRMNESNARAASTIYRANNAGRPDSEVDLHGLRVAEATAKVRVGRRRRRRRQAVLLHRWRRREGGDSAPCLAVRGVADKPQGPNNWRSVCRQQQQQCTGSGLLPPARQPKGRSRSQPPSRAEQAAGSPNRHPCVLRRLLQVEAAVAAARARGDKRLVLIVGRGLHSRDGVAKLKPAVLDQLINKHSLRCTPGVPNEGCVLVELVRPEERGWLGAVLGDGGCVIM